MEELANSCEQAKSYPHNLIHPNTYEYNLTAYYQRLNEREESLFQNDAEAALDFWEFDAQGHGASANLKPVLHLVYSSLLTLSTAAFWPSRIGYVDELKKHMRIHSLLEREDPRCRFV